jgi:hypothetical protein
MVRRSCLIDSLAIAGCLLAASNDAPTETRSEPNALPLTSFESTVEYGTVTVLVPSRGRGRNRRNRGADCPRDDGRRHPFVRHPRRTRGSRHRAAARVLARTREPLPRARAARVPLAQERAA